MLIVVIFGVVADICAEKGSVTGLTAVVDDEDDKEEEEEEAVGAKTEAAAAGDEDRDPCFEDIAPAPLLEALAV